MLPVVEIHAIDDPGQTSCGLCALTPSFKVLRYSLIYLCAYMVLTLRGITQRGRPSLSSTASSTTTDDSVSPLSRETSRTCADGLTTTCNSNMEHTATIIICKKNPNVSESGVSPQARLRGSWTYQGIYQTGVNRHKDPEELGWSKRG